MLQVSHLVKIFQNKKVLDAISFQMHPGQITVLLGSSGVGKSTVLRVLNNLEIPDGGSITLDHMPIDFKKVGMVFQDFNLFTHLTVEENIMLPLTAVAKKTTAEATKIAQALLIQFGLESKATALPAALSGGQKQRVALARTLAMNPKLLCLDEPTSALDPHLKLEIAHIIKNLAQQGYMILLSTHDTALVKMLPCTILLMRDGKIIETATMQELQKNSNDFENIKNFIA